jgi:hypothetical protein
MSLYMHRKLLQYYTLWTAAQEADMHVAVTAGIMDTGISRENITR